MADSYYKLSPSDENTRHTFWPTEVVLERDAKTGEPTKVVRAGEPVSLSASDKKKVEALGLKLESSSKAEAEQAQATGGDVTGSSPVFGSGEEPDQSETKSK